MPPFAQLRIRIGRGGGTGDGYPVEAELDDGSHVRGRLDLDRARLLALQLDAERYGSYLFDALFVGPIRDAYQYSLGGVQSTSAGQLRVLLWIDDDALDLHQVAWERLHQVRQGSVVPLAASVQTPFSRYVPGSGPLRQPVPTRPIRLLIAVSSPEDLPPPLAPIDADQEIESLSRALGDLRGNPDIRVTIMPGWHGLSPAFEADLRASGYEVVRGATSAVALWRAVSTHHVLHFLGHGKFRVENGRRGESALFLERENGSMDLAREDYLAAKIASQESLPLLTFLSACESAAGGDGIDPLVGLGPKLVGAGIPAVIAMQGVVATGVARDLAHDFYRRLSEHGRVDLALNEARQVLFDARHPTWSAPVLFSRLADGALFYPRDQANTAVGARDKVLDPTPSAGVAVDVLAAPITVRPRAGPVVSLPRPPRGFLDRQTEVPHAVGLLNAGSSVEVYGPAGVGKTSLLKQLACAGSLRGPDGVVYLARGKRTVDEILQSLVDATHETDANYRASEPEIRRLLQNRRLLVAVDDLDVDREEVERLLDAVPSATMLLAARDRNIWDGDTRTLRLDGLPVDDCVLLFERELDRPCTRDERASVEAFAMAVAGNPLEIVQAAARCREDGVDPRRLSGADSGARDDLSSEERSALDVLTALRGAPVHVDHLEAITRVLDLVPALEMLERRGLARSGSPWYWALEAPGAEGIGLKDAGLWRDHARTHFAYWTSRNSSDLGLVLLHADALLASLEDASVGEDYDAIARPLERALVVGRRWGTWGRLIARELDDGEVDLPRRAFALHQAGSRSLALDRPGAAVSALKEALELRVELGDHAGAELTRHNLQVAVGAAAEAQRLERKEGARSDVISRWPFTKWMWFVLLLSLAVGAFVGIRRLLAPSDSDSGITVSSGVVRFDAVPVGETRRRAVTLVNEGDVAVRVADVSIDPARSVFGVTDDCSTTPVEAGDSCKIRVTFSPIRASEETVSVVIVGSEGELERVRVEGTGVEVGGGSALTIEPDELEVDGTRRSFVRITSTGTDPLHIDAVEIDGKGFVVVAETCTTQDSIDRGDTCTIHVGLDPETSTRGSAVLRVESDAEGGPHVVALTAPSEPNLVIEGFSTDIEKARLAEDSYYVVPVDITVANVGTAPAVASLVAFEASGASGRTIVPFYEASAPQDVAMFGSIDPLEPGTTDSLPGYVRIPPQYTGLVTLIATADSCLVQTPEVSPCPVVESDETDNFAEVDVEVPQRVD